jgi:hypothetical protein
VVTADFSQVGVGQSVEGMGVVAPGLNIDAKGTAVMVMEGEEPIVYAAPNEGVTAGRPVANGGMNVNGGFSDLATKTALQAHQYTFTFASGTTVSQFSLRMLDFGDFNPAGGLNHYVSMTAYNVNNAVVSKAELSYTASLDLTSSPYGNLNITGDAITAVPGQPGNWTWNVSGANITRIVLEFGDGYDPNIAFDTLTFTTECE